MILSLIYIYRTQHQKFFIVLFSLIYISISLKIFSRENFFICDSLIYKKYITKIFLSDFFQKNFSIKLFFKKNFSLLFLIEKNFLIVKNFSAKIFRKIILKISKFTIALCVNVCYYNSVVKIAT